ncbi:MAG: (d)CMP kinase [Planctomycetota bacterium]|jgi:cytidylate kinase|nr:(d)CMP kinase [Planctomycetota bacterium]
MQISALAIDGPAGSGKSTVAQAAAARLRFTYIDTGAMYRALAWKALRLKIDLTDEAALTALAQKTAWQFADNGATLMLDGENVSAAIRAPEVTNHTKFAARAAGVRAHLVALQRQMAAERPAVMEGRDITTVVLPAARWRIFLTAAPEVRARRRQEDWARRGFGGAGGDYDEILRDILARDESDFSIGPLKDALDLAQAGKIILLDTSAMSPAAVIDRVIAIVE